jgi:hypothetical protein
MHRAARAGSGTPQPNSIYFPRNPRIGADGLPFIYVISAIRGEGFHQLLTLHGLNLIVAKNGPLGVLRALV